MDANAKIPVEVDLPLVFDIASRDSSFSKDALMQNVYIDALEDGQKYVVKRPGTQLFTTYSGGGVATGQGLWYYNGFVLAASDNTLTRISSPTSTGYTSGGAWSNTFNATWKGRRGHASIVFNNQIFVIGGTYDGTNQLNDVWSSADGKTWTQLVSAAPFGYRQSHALAVLNDVLYLMGGNSSGTFYNDVWSTTDGVNWNQVTSNAGWSARGGHNAVTFNNGIWVFGGAATSDVWFSTDGANWSQMVVNAGWAARTGQGAVVFNNRIYMYGGTVNGREVWYTSDGITWTLATSTAFSNARQGFAYCVYNGAMWAIGGLDGGGTYLTQVWYSSDGVNWTQPTAAFGGTGRFAPTAVVFKAQPTVSTIDATTIYMLGGQDSTPVYQQQVWTANLDGNFSTSLVISGATTPYLPMQAVPVNNNQYLAIKDTRGMYIWYQNAVTKITDPNYPIETVPGVVNLDETVYVMTPDALIMGSSLQNPFTWPSTKYIGADYLSDGGVAIARYNNFLVAFGELSTQLFYNSGAPGPILLRAQKNANSDIGCAFAYSVVELSGTVFWVGKSAKAKGRQVFMFNGLSPLAISTPIVDTLLDLSLNVKATGFTANGHVFYLLTCDTFTLAYDLRYKKWFRFVYQNGAWQAHNIASDGNTTYLLSDTSKEVFTLDSTVYQDNGSSIIIELRTPVVDNGTLAWKTCNRASIILDRQTSGTVELSYTDDDYQTWSTPRNLTINATRCTTTRLGRYRRRAWKIRHFANTPFRAKTLIPELRIGNM